MTRGRPRRHERLLADDGIRFVRGPKPLGAEAVAAIRAIAHRLKLTRPVPPLTEVPVSRTSKRPAGKKKPAKRTTRLARLELSLAVAVNPKLGGPPVTATTSAPVASLAGHIDRLLQAMDPGLAVRVADRRLCTVAELRSVLGSTLRQRETAAARPPARPTR